MELKQAVETEEKLLREKCEQLAGTFINDYTDKEIIARMTLMKLGESFIKAAKVMPEEKKHTACLGLDNLTGEMKESRTVQEWRMKGWNDCREQAILAAAGIMVGRDALKVDNDRLKKELADAKEEIEVDNKLLNRHNELIHKIPPCPEHGAECIPHAEEWVENVKEELARVELALFENDKEKQENYKEKWRKRAVKAEAEIEQLKKEMNLSEAELSRVRGITVEELRTVIMHKMVWQSGLNEAAAAIHRLYQGVK